MMYISLYCCYWLLSVVSLLCSTVIRCAMCDGVTANEVDKEYGIKICDKCRKSMLFSSNLKSLF